MSLIDTACSSGRLKNLMCGLNSTSESKTPTSTLCIAISAASKGKG